MTPLDEIAGFGDVPIPIQVEISRPLMKLGQLIALRPGQVVALARSAGENIDVRAAGALIGHGEVIVSENGVGVRITDLRSDG